tara:strand:+ start:180 stop:476 length:297 start_codon:yes stop_codon:yes gene_type:complete
MTQYKDEVEKQRRSNRLAVWRKGIKLSYGLAIDNGKDVEHLTIFNDDSTTLEYLRSDRKTEITPSPHSHDDLIDMMLGDENKTAELIIRKKLAGENNE